MFTTPILSVLLLSSGYQVVTTPESVWSVLLEYPRFASGTVPQAAPGTAVSLTARFPRGAYVEGGDTAPDNPWSARFATIYNNQVLVDEQVTGVIPAGKSYYWGAVWSTYTEQGESVRKTPGGKAWVGRFYQNIQWTSGSGFMMYSN